ncbi:MAG: RICIN domain-containing protein, partial [Bacteriovoracales bacterium]
MKRIYFYLLILIFPIIASSEEIENKELKLPTVNFHAGMIPLEYGQRPATDLVYNGMILLPDEAHKLVVDSGGTFDLSLLDPDATSVLWTKRPIKPLKEFSDDIPVENDDEVSFVDLVPSRSGNLRFTIQKEDDLGVKKSYTVMLSKTTHNILLKRNLLRKLGYKIPKIKYLKSFKLKFSSSMEKAVFFSDFADRTFGDPGRWVKNYQDHLVASDRLTEESEREVYSSFSEVPKNQLKEVGSDKCLVSNPKSNKRMMLGDCSQGRLSSFVIEDKGNSFFAIRNALNGKCIGIKNGSNFETARFVEDVCDYKENQLFTKEIENGGFKLKVKQTGLCISDKWKREILSQGSCDGERVISWYLGEGLNLDGPLFYDKEIELHDVVVMETSDQFYNLAMGFLTPEIIEGRRILNSLLVPFSLVDIPESVNLFSWQAGRIINKQLKLEYETAENFNPSFEDAKWITRKILELTRPDWEEIVSEAYFPIEVGALITEKLISRRNQLREILSLEGENLDFDPRISMGEKLEKGELKGEYWEGHASRYSYGDPENPLSKSEIGHFIGSTIISSILSGVIDFVGSKWLNNSSFLNTAYQNRMNGLQLDAFLKFLETGVVQNIPVGVFIYPTFSGNLILSRDMVIGSYLGTDNRVQLADTFGFYVNAGAVASIYGIATGVPVSVSGRGSVTYSRTYSHLKPIMSFQASFKYPFRNVLVPWFKQKQGRLFDELLAGTFEKLPEDKKQEKIDEIIKLFKKNFGIGESLLISDNVIVGANLSTGVGIGQVVKLSGQIGGQNLTLSRLHIYRKDENTLHIYKDLGNVSSLIMGLQADAVVPVLKISLKASKGKATTNFYSLNLEPKLEKNSKIKETIIALRGLFKKNSVDLLKKLGNPFKIVHRFRETLSKGSLAMLRSAKSRGDT